MMPEDLLATITKATRRADETFETVGGSSRHWVRDCFLPELEKVGLMITTTNATDLLQAEIRQLRTDQGHLAWNLNQFMAQNEQLSAALLAILDAVDYVAGNCRLNEMVGAVLPAVLLGNARLALKQD